MPLDQLLAALDREASGTVDQVLEAARTEAARLVAEADAEVTRRRRIAVDLRTSELNASLARELGVASRRARGEALAARDLLVGRVLEAMAAALPAALEREQYRAALPGRLDAALACVAEGEPATLTCAPGIAKAVRQVLDGRAGVAVEEDVHAGSGFRLTAQHGALEVDDTLESRLARQRTRIGREALRLLGIGQ